jgi:hypothetical protein
MMGLMPPITENSPLRNDNCALTHAEVAEIMTARGYPMCRGRVWQIEKKALQKLAAEPEFREVAAELGFILSTE